MMIDSVIAPIFLKQCDTYIMFIVYNIAQGGWFTGERKLQRFIRSPYISGGFYQFLIYIYSG